MSANTLAIISIILSETVLVLIAIIIFLIFRLRRAKSTTATNVPTKSSNENGTLAFINSLIQLTETRLTQLDITKEAPLHLALQKRLGLLKAESNILVKDNLNNNEVEYWKFIEREFAANDDDISSNKEQIYQSRISNLEDFKNLFLDAEKKLIESLATIDELRNLTQEKPEPDIEKIVAKINDLKTENKQLQEKIELSKNELDKSLDSLKAAEANNSDEELDSLKEENEFLVTQIQHLLQQEVATSKKMMDNIDSLTKSLHEKELECENLSTQLASESTG